MSQSSRILALIVFIALITNLHMVISEGYKNVVIMWDTVVKGSYRYRIEIAWKGTGVTRELMASSGHSHFYGMVFFNRTENINKNVSVSVVINSTAIYDYMGFGGRAKMREEYANNGQHSSVGISFDVETINFKEKSEVSLFIPPKGKGCPTSKIEYITSTVGIGEISIGSVWYWQFPDPSMLFYRKATASGRFEIYTSIIFKDRFILEEVDAYLAPAHPISP